MPNDDYISREAVAEMLSRKTIQYSADKALQAATAISEARICLTGVPAADVVEVVRCKDCRFYAIKQSSLCDMHNTAVNAEDYCSYGTKMDGGEHRAD